MDKGQQHWQINNMKETNKLTTNYHLAWTMGIIHRYPIGKSPGDTCIAYDKNAVLTY